MFKLPLKSVPGSTWPAIPRGDVSQLVAMVLGLESNERLTVEEIVQGQLAQFRTLLDHATRHVPYYAETLRGIRAAEIASVADLRNVPLVSRSVFQARTADFLASSLPVGTRPTTVMRTSGTTGIPIEIRQTNLVNLWWFAFHLRDLLWCGVDFRGSLAVIRGFDFVGPERELAMNGIRQPAWNDQFPMLIENGPAFAMDILQDPRRQLEWLQEIQPNYLLSYPRNLEYLASLLLDAGDRIPSLRAVLTIAEALTDPLRAVIESGFGVPAKNTYSCVEAGYVASPCPEGHGLHVHAENVLLEVLREDGQPCGPGETGRVVLTTLQNFLNPLIRYEILDHATLGPERCPCGRGLPLLLQIDGKQRPQIRLPDGRRKDSGFLVRELRQIGGYRQHQIVQPAPDRLIVRLVPSMNWSSGHIATITDQVRRYLEYPIAVDVELLERIEQTEAGKVRDVIVFSDP